MDADECIRETDGAYERAGNNQKKDAVARVAAPLTARSVQRVHSLYDGGCAVLGALLPYVTLQLVVLPLLAVRLSPQELGALQFLLLLLHCLAAPFGGAVGVSQALAPQGKRRVSDHLWVLLLCVAILLLSSLFLARLGGYFEDLGTLLSYAALFCAVAWRRYAEVALCRSRCYGRYLLLSAAVGLGCVTGLVLLHRAPHLWPLCLLLGELCGLLVARVPGSTPRLAADWTVFRTVLPLFLMETLSRLALDGTELLVGLLGGPTALVTYHLAAFVGRAQLLAAVPLGSMLSGRFAGADGVSKVRLMRGLLVLLLPAACVLALTGALGTWGALRLFYPAYLGSVARFLLPVNLEKALLLVTNAITVCVFRFSGTRAVIILRIAHGFALLVLGIPVLLLWGLGGFVRWALLSTLLRFLMTVSFFQRSLYEKR